MRRFSALAVPVVLAVTAFPAPGHAAPPNVVVVMTDDQTLGQMQALSRTERLIGNQGVTFTHYFATQPLCCPSRASYLTGQYPHNHGVRDNDPPDGGYEAFRPRRALPVWLDRAGYRTMLVGKYLNGYARHPREIPPGWDEWAVLAGDLKLYDYDLNKDGKLVHYGDDRRDYATDVYARESRSFVRRRHRAGGPFFLSVAPTAPHLENGLQADEPHNPRPAPRHRDAFQREPLPRPPSYDEEDVSDKPTTIRGLGRIDTATRSGIKNRWRAALASLLAVDDLVAGLVKTLDKTGELERTVFVFTSDNGYFYGEHRLKHGKNRVYEEATHLPLLIRGPGIPRGEERPQLAANIDLAPTILDATGAESDLAFDGRSLLPFVHDPAKPGRSDLLLESLTFSAIRTERWTYAENPGDSNELYDLTADPFQLENQAGDPAHASIEQDLGQRLDELRACAGANCR